MARRERVMMAAEVLLPSLRLGKKILSRRFVIDHRFLPSRQEVATVVGSTIGTLTAFGLFGGTCNSSFAVYF
jgi:hypothetical protein